MNTTEAQTLRQALIAETEKLPEGYLQEALDFVRFLIFKATYQAPERKKPLDPQQNNPLLKLIGIADVEPFADRIDQELYGELP
jgi:hypothetical protein